MPHLEMLLKIQIWEILTKIRVFFLLLALIQRLLQPKCFQLKLRFLYQSLDPKTRLEPELRWNWLFHQFFSAFHPFGLHCWECWPVLEPCSTCCQTSTDLWKFKLLIILEKILLFCIYYLPCLVSGFVYQADIVMILVTWAIFIAFKIALILSVNFVIGSSNCLGNPKTEIIASFPEKQIFSKTYILSYQELGKLIEFMYLWRLKPKTLHWKHQLALC